MTTTHTDPAPALDLAELRRLAEIARSQYAGIDGSVIWDIEIVGGPECCGNALPNGECCGNPRDGREQQQVQIGGGPHALLEFLDAAVEAMPVLLDELERAREALDEAEDGNIAQTLANYRAIRRAVLASKKEMHHDN
jgi:hypothetical protein